MLVPVTPPRDDGTIDVIAGALDIEVAQVRLRVNAFPIENDTLVIAVGVPHEVELIAEGLTQEKPQIQVRLDYTLEDEDDRIAVGDGLRVSVGSERMNNDAYCTDHPDNSDSPLNRASSLARFDTTRSRVIVSFCATAPLRLKMSVDVGDEPVGLDNLLAGDGLDIRAERRAVIAFRPKPLEVPQGSIPPVMLDVSVLPQGILPDVLETGGSIRVRLFDSTRKRVFVSERPVFGEERRSGISASAEFSIDSPGPKQIPMWAAANARVGTVAYLGDFGDPEMEPEMEIMLSELRATTLPVVFEGRPEELPVAVVVKPRVSVRFSSLEAVLAAGLSQTVRIQLEPPLQGTQTITLRLRPVGLSQVSVNPQRLTMTTMTETARVTLLASRPDQQGHLQVDAVDDERNSVSLNEPGRLPVTVLPQAEVVFRPTTATVIAGCGEYRERCSPTTVTVTTDPVLQDEQYATLLLSAAQQDFGLQMDGEDAPGRLTVRLSADQPSTEVVLTAGRDVPPATSRVSVSVLDENIRSVQGLDITPGDGLEVTIRRPRYTFAFTDSESGEAIDSLTVIANDSVDFGISMRPLDGVPLPTAAVRVQWVIRRVGGTELQGGGIVMLSRANAQQSDTLQPAANAEASVNLATEVLGDQVELHNAEFINAVLSVQIDPRSFRLEFEPQTIPVNVGARRQATLSLVPANDQSRLAGGERVGVTLRRISGGNINGISVTVPDGAGFTAGEGGNEVRVTILADENATGDRATWEAVLSNANNIEVESEELVIRLFDHIELRIRVLLEGPLR